MNASRIRTCLVAGCALLLSQGASASYGVYVGKHLTADGSVFLGGTGDEPSSHWLEIVPRKTHDAADTVLVGVGKEATPPGEFMPIPQVAVTARYITMNYSYFLGTPAPLTNGGLNEYGVAARDIWSSSRSELVAMTPTPQHGPNYSDLSRIAMERAHSAREAVEILGALIDRYGYSDYGGNSHMFADANEGWVLIDYAGGKGLWIAERLGPDDVRMSYPGYILALPLDFQKHPDKWRGSANFISFAVSQGWFDPKAGRPFNVSEVYKEDGLGRSPTVKIIEERLTTQSAHAKLTLRQFMDTIRDPLMSADWNGYGQVAHLRQGVKQPDLHMLWVAATGSVTTPFVPYWIGVEHVQPEYGKHRYLTEGEAAGFVTKDFQIQEASEFAFTTFKRLMYYTCDQPAKFLPEVTEALAAFENQSIAWAASVEARAGKLFAVGEPAMARDTLTAFSDQRAKDALALGHDLLGSIEARYRLLYGARTPVTDQVSLPHHREGVNCRVPRP